ncbi:uncharacterized protein LOC134250491 [Saccostrea cucullata]|uniref:uncharacterized protein LOC134250491 n=1 Tax=Saccostrea cuccullata TaxID=36930 RepID=UPI002ED04DE9
MNTQNQSETLDFGEDPVTSVDAKLAILSFPYSWAEIVEQEEKFKNEILDFGENPVTSVEAKLAILAFSYKWAEMVEREEKLQTEILDFGEDPVTSVEAKLAILSFGYNWADMVEQEEKSKNNRDIPRPQEYLDQTNFMTTTAEAGGSSTTELDKTKLSAFPLVEESKGLCDSNEANVYKDTSDANVFPEQKDSHPLQLGGKDKQDAAEANSDASRAKMASRIDNSVIQCMKRLVHIYDAKTGIVVGEIHAQYPQLEQNGPLNRAEFGSTVLKVSKTVDLKTTTTDGETASCSTDGSKTVACNIISGTTTSSIENRTKKIRGLEIIDTEISILSTEIAGPDIQESKNQETDAENEYFTKHPLMRLFLCGACSCTKKGKSKGTEKRGLFQRIRKFFHRN